MNKGSTARLLRKLRTSRNGWKERAAQKQDELSRLRGTVRDLTTSREQWKMRAKELQEQVQSLQQTLATVGADGPAGLFFLGGR